ncbi:HAD family hydrolase [Paracoccus pacificus]|uniref:HAD family hydrolase n=1 Tax=Paracoccus pacificus TaxID=1463598 RepID=A0ABW4R591_9RHOB
MTAAIFDCDGVLVNTEMLSAEAYRNVYARHGLTIEPAAFQNMLGLKRADTLRTLPGREGGVLPPEAAPELSAEILDLIRAKAQPMPGIADVLRELHVPFCVASSSDVARVRLSLAASRTDQFTYSRVCYSVLVRLRAGYAGRPQMTQTAGAPMQRPPVTESL